MFATYGSLFLTALSIGFHVIMYYSSAQVWIIIQVNLHISCQSVLFAVLNIRIQHFRVTEGLNKLEILCSFEIIFFLVYFEIQDSNRPYGI
jgi:hypothetical protein